MRKLFGWVAVFAAIGVVTGLAWLAYGRFNSSEAAEFDESIAMVNHQTAQISTSLGDTGEFVNREVSKITDISLLLRSWTPRYDSAQAAYTKFDAAITAAEGRAEDYFAAQRVLTQRYNNPESRAIAEAKDITDYSLYVKWRDQANSVRQEALSIVNRLEDVDTDLKKLKLASEFSFDSNAFRTVPADILALEDELTHFRTASESIRAITKSPFEVSQ